MHSYQYSGLAEQFGLLTSREEPEPEPGLPLAEQFDLRGMLEESYYQSSGVFSW